MRLNEVAQKLDLKVRSAAKLLDVEVRGGYASDLLSDVIANAEEGYVWVTLQTHVNIVAVAAMKAIDVEPKMSIIRGGTDGSRLTEMGLPTPNLATGMHNFHSPLEWACLEEMEIAVRGLVALARLWGGEKK